MADQWVDLLDNANAKPKPNLAASAAPTVTDDSASDYATGSRWTDTTNNKDYVCTDATVGAAVWVETTGAGGSGSSTWIGLTDTDPTTFSGQAGQAVLVNPGETGLEFGSNLGTAAEIEAVVSHDNLQNVNASEHIDWTQDQGATNIEPLNVPELSAGAAGLAPASGGGTANYLRADGLWQSPPAAGAEVNDLTDAVVWTNVPDANITESSVTQHEAAIDHDALTNTGGNAHIDWELASQGTIHATNYTVTPVDTEQVVVSARSSSGTITSGQAVFITGWDVGSGFITVELAQADSSGTMPAYGIAKSTIGTSTTGQVVVSGSLEAIDTTGIEGTSPAAGKAVYSSAATAGALTVDKPTGANLIQKLGIINRIHGSLGVIQVVGAGRSNDVPNIAQDNVWMGNGSGVATATARAGIDTDATTHAALTNEHIDWEAASAGTIHTDNYIEGGAGTDTTAIHDDTGSEISAITAKGSPTSADFLLIEDAAAANAKKSITIGDIPGFSASNVEVQDEGSQITASVTTLNFLGSGVVAADAGGDAVDVTIELGTAAVNKVFDRTGDIVAVASDYDASQIDNDSSVTGAFVDDALNTLGTHAALVNEHLDWTADLGATNINVANVPVVATGADGLAPASGGGTTNFLRADGTWTAPTAAEVNDLSAAVTWANVPNANVTEGSVTQHTAAVVTTAAVTTAGALMDSEVDADIKTFALPASTTISPFGATLVDDLNEGAARTTLGTPSLLTTITGTGQLTGGGDLSANRTIDLAADIGLTTITLTDGAESTEYAEYGIAPYGSRVTQFTIGGAVQTGTIIDMSFLGSRSDEAGLAAGDVYFYGGIANTGDTDGGNAYIYGGNPSGSGTQGTVTLDGSTINVIGPLTTNSTIDGIDVATDVAANTAKVTNATHTGDVTGATALTIAANAVTNAKSAQMATLTIKGNNTGGLADPIDLTGTEVSALLTHDLLQGVDADEHHVIRHDVTANIGAASSYTDEYFFDTTIKALYYSDGAAWFLVGMPVDDTTIEATTDIHVKDGGIDTAQLADDAVTVAKMDATGITNDYVITASSGSPVWAAASGGGGGADFTSSRIASYTMLTTGGSGDPGSNNAVPSNASPASTANIRYNPENENAVDINFLMQHLAGAVLVIQKQDDATEQHFFRCGSVTYAGAYYFVLTYIDGTGENWTVDGTYDFILHSTPDKGLTTIGGSYYASLSGAQIKTYQLNYGHTYHTLGTTVSTTGTYDLGWMGHIVSSDADCLAYRAGARRISGSGTGRLKVYAQKKNDPSAGDVSSDLLVNKLFSPAASGDWTDGSGTSLLHTASAGDVIGIEFTSTATSTWSFVWSMELAYK